MDWQTVVLIGIAAAVVLAIPVIYFMGKIFKRVFGMFDSIHNEIAHDFGSDPFEDLEKRVAKMTGPGRNPFK